MKELNQPFINRNGQETARLVQKVFDYNQPTDKEAFLKNYSNTITVSGTKLQMNYDAVPRTAIVHSKLGASKAIGLGAYMFALRHL
jgi:glucokinase